MRHLIVARYREDVSWLDGQPALRAWTPWVITKDVEVPNEGREASSYLHAILTLYESLRQRDLLAFVQGNPFDHCPNLLHELTHKTEGFRPLGHWRVHSDAWGNPWHNGLPVGVSYERWLGKPFPGRVDFTAGGQFVLTSKDIKHYPRSFYETLLAESGGPGPWVLERLWEAIFAR